MTFTMQALTRSLADYLAPVLPGFTFYDNPNQQGTRLPAMFLQRTKAKIVKKMGDRFLRTLGLDLVCLVELSAADMEDRYARAAGVLDEALETFPYKITKRLRGVKMDILIYGLLAVSIGLSVLVIVRNLKK